MNQMHYKKQLLADLYKPYENCTGCHFNMPPATQIVFGEGNPNANILFIGEAPGREEDLQGRPFVGRSGKLLDKVIQLVGSSRQDVYITNVVKIRPPNNRKPSTQEILSGKQLLLNQIKIIRPHAICTLGSSALEGLLDQPIKITAMRGKKIDWNGIPLIPAYHPAYILRNPKELQTFVDDISLVLQSYS